MKPEIYDYAIVGAGAAGLHLALAMMEDDFFRSKKILILEKELKDHNDRTWCFWETGDGKWDTIAHRIWMKGTFITSNATQQLDIHPYRYKMVRSIDFYGYAKRQIASATNFTWKQANIIGMEEEQVVTIKSDGESYFASHVFDSRIESEHENIKRNYVKVLQHFKGWVIETKDDVFTPDSFIMMDFRLKWKNQTGFTYILPSSKRKALVEFTLFTPELINESDYENMLRNYIRDILKVSEFTIEETEYGVIPMTNYPFHRHSTDLVTKIGTAGSWVKPSSGYSFKNAERFSQQIIKNIKNAQPPAKGIAVGRFRKYDTLFLEILQNHNELGEEIFTSMYFKNPASQIFKFLDEDTTILEDIKIISSFHPAPFRNALMKHWKALIK